METGLASVTERMLALRPVERATALCEGPVTIDLDTTDVEVYGGKKEGMEYNYQGQRCGRPHVAVWAETETVLAADLGSGTDDPRASADGLLTRALAGLPRRARRERVAVRADAGCGSWDHRNLELDLERRAGCLGGEARFWRDLGRRVTAG